MDPAKLKVVELRAELSQRGLDTKGNKAVLVERLRKALEENETEAEAEEASTPEPAPQESRSKTPESNKPPQTPSKASTRTSRSLRGTPAKASSKTPPTPQKQPSPVKPPVVEKPASPIIDKETEAALLEEDEPQSGAVPQTAVEELTEAPKVDSRTPQVAEEAPEIPPAQQDDSVQESKQSEVAPVITASSEASEPPELPEQPIEEPNEEPNEEPDNETQSVELPEEPEENDEPIDIKTEDGESSERNDTQTPEDENQMPEMMEVQEEVSSVLEEIETETTAEVKSELPEEKPEAPEENPELPEKLELPEEKPDVQMKEENFKIENEHEAPKAEDIKQQEDIKQEEDQSRNDRKDRKRKRSTSSDHPKSPPPPEKADDEPELDNSRVLLSWYDSDLNLVIDRSTLLSATPMHTDGFGYVWAGARASFGFTSGKVYYEVKVKHECNITLQDEEHPHLVRVGWSVVHSSMQLGEEKWSYGYGGTGKISTENDFKDYGSRFGLNDVLGCYLDMSGEEVSMTYILNGKNLGTAFSVSKAELEGKALYPHILTKNCEISCNFGDEEPWDPTPLEGFVPVGQVDIKDRVPGPLRPERREDCEMIMMCGLPGAGKTYWATKYALEHREKMYNVLGTNNLIEKMKVTGLPRRRNYHGRWDVLIDKCTRCLNKLLDVAATRRRNYILDQTNVYPSAQQRKMRHFHGFQRRAVVIVPTDEEFKARTAKRISVEGKDVPDSAIMEMKANFEAPAVGNIFDVVDWVELDKDEGKKVIAMYRKEGEAAGFAQQPTTKRPRFEKTTESNRDHRDVRQNRDNRDRRNPYPDRNRNSTWRGGSQMSGGWRDRAPRGGHMRPPGPYGPPGVWRGRGGPPGPMNRPNERRGAPNDRRGGSDRRGAGAGRGGWGPMNNNYNSGSSGGWGGSQGGVWASGQPGGWGGGQGWGAQGGWGSWKGYGSNSNYNQSNYNQQSYGNGNWGGWGQQYYNQYWSQQQPASGQSSTSSGQSSIAGINSTTPASTTSTGSSYNNYPQGWQGYTQSYNYSTDVSNTSVQQEK
ncbi:heterogeneous nuclear ribonucleoprotein U-like protein 1 [Diachasmimorpha longicaudata]|uniref:heterogeneous nuclear ribonucleoprotein U-like protein 1 n=1 Tax=Diachasmimorpha longicaudata TaxID=58733 RepID=UPI0030B88A78